MSIKNNPPIVIAKDDPQKYLMSIALRLMTNDEIKIHVTNKHLAKADYLIRILRKSFGCIEIERNTVETKNAICIFNEDTKCINEKANFQGTCNDAIRINCPHYKPKYKNTFEVNEIKIEKIAAIKSL